MQIPSLCTFSQCVSTSDQKHQWFEELSSLIHKILQSKKNPLDDTRNLVFQGGGVKGVAFLGALEEAQSEGKKRGCDFLGGIEKTAGTSAGAIVALYLALNMDLEKDIRPLIERGFDTLLDDNLILKVKLNKFFGLNHKNFKAKHIVLKALKYFENLNITLESGDPQLKQEAKKKLQKAVKKVLRYYGKKLGFFPSLALKVKGADFARDAAQWLFDVLEPCNKTEPTKVQDQAEASKISEESIKNLSVPVDEDGFDQRSTGPETGNFDSTRQEVLPENMNPAEDFLDLAPGLVRSSEAHENSSRFETLPDEREPTFKRIENSSNIYHDDFNPPIEGNLDSNMSLGQNDPKLSNKDESSARRPSGNDAQHSTNPKKSNPIKRSDSSITNERSVRKTKEDSEKKNVKKNKRKIIAAAPEKELTWDLLPTALGELLWFIVISQQNAAGVQEPLGVFDGSEVKKELIEKPINDHLLKLNLVPKSDLTFKELMDYNADLQKREERKFKQVYVTAFNTETSKTEVFSAEHTPNVVIADAVRASMSIPVFFTPVTIREKDSSGQLKERILTENPVHYMDGGILDNYPLWIFDDIKYFGAKDSKSGTNMKFSIQNPQTLGFRLLDTDTIEKYTNPHFLRKVVTGQEKTKEFKEKFFYQIGLLLNAVANEAQENEHLKREDCTRSVYIDNKGVTAISFSLSDDQRNALIESGRQSVRDYQIRAKKYLKSKGQIN